MTDYESTSLIIGGATLIIYIVGAGVAGWAAFSAFKTLKAQKEAIRLQDVQFKKESANYKKNKLTEEAIKCLERAFLSFIPTGQTTPSTERIVWLATARQIQSYLTLKNMIAAIDPATNDPHMVVCESNEAHWRHAFYQAIPDDFFDNYVHITAITDTRHHMNLDGRVSLEPLSVLSVLGFAGMTSEKKDPVETVDVDSSIEAIGLRFHGLRQKFLERREHLLTLAQSYSENSSTPSTE